MATYEILEGSVFEKQGNVWVIEGIKFTTANGYLLCPLGTIRPDNCKGGSSENDVTEEQAKAHLQWMADDFEARGSGE